MKEIPLDVYMREREREREIAFVMEHYQNMVQTLMRSVFW